MASLDYRDIVSMNICLLMDIAKTVLGRQDGDNAIPSEEDIRKEVHKKLNEVMLDSGIFFETEYMADIPEISCTNDLWTLKLSYNRDCVYAKLPAFWLEGVYVHPRFRRRGVFTSVMKALVSYKQVKAVSFVPTSKEILQWLHKHDVPDARLDACVSISAEKICSSDL